MSTSITRNLLAIKSEVKYVKSIAISAQQTLQELKQEFIQEKSNQAKKIGGTILTSIILAISLVALTGIILLSLCLGGYLSSLTMALGSQHFIILALIACSIVFLVCSVAVVCLFINGAIENKISIK